MNVKKTKTNTKVRVCRGDATDIGPHRQSDSHGPDTERYQFHPRHGCLNPLLPFVGRLFWNIPVLLGGGNKRAPRVRRDRAQAPAAPAMRLPPRPIQLLGVANQGELAGTPS